MADKKYAFLRQVPSAYLKTDERTGQTKVTVLGDKESANDRVQIDVAAADVFPSTDKSGRTIPKHFNIRLPAGQDIEVSYVNDEGNTVRGTRKAESIANNWAKNQREYAEKQGPKVWLNGVSPEMIHPVEVPTKSGAKRQMINVSVADPQSVPAPGKDQGYGGFMVSPDVVTPAKVHQDEQGNDKPQKFNIYVGRENDKISGYSIRTGEVNAEGKAVFAKVDRTAADIKAQYEANIEAFKTKAKEQTAELPKEPEAPSFGD